MATDFAHCRTWAGFVYVAFIVDVYPHVCAQRIVAWHAATTNHTDLVMVPLRIGLRSARADWPRLSSRDE